MSQSQFYQQDPYSYNNPYTNQNQYYQKYSNFDNNQQKRPVNGLEVAIVLFSIILLIIPLIWGFWISGPSSRDEKRRHDIEQVAVALDYFYQNSNSNPSDRSYPIAICSNSANEVDFEATLRYHLTGKRPDLDNYSYIDPEKFPKDITGVYSTSLENRRSPFTCDKILSPTSTTIYENNYPSCNLNISDPNLRNCYLYGSSVNGDTYYLAYYSETRNAYVFFTKFRSEPIQTQIQNI